MQYLMLICGPETSPETGPQDTDPALHPDAVAWTEQMQARGVHRFGSALHPTSSDTTVRMREEELLFSDGPFAETKEQILGFDLIDCADLDEAIEVAASHPAARFGSIEVRPLW